MEIRMIAKRAGLACMLGGLLALSVGCEAEKGPAEKAGESVDNAVQKAQNTINPPGPAEKAGQAVDKTLNP